MIIHLTKKVILLSVVALWASTVLAAPRMANALGRMAGAGGLNMIHSPILDVNVSPDNPEIYTRAFRDRAEIVTEYALEQATGFKDAGNMRCGLWLELRASNNILYGNYLRGNNGRHSTGVVSYCMYGGPKILYAAQYTIRAEAFAETRRLVGGVKIEDVS